jgi:hypothetical protein
MTAINVSLIVADDATAERRERAGEVGRALAEAGVSAHTEAPGHGAPDSVRLVRADELAAALGALPEDRRERWLDGAVLVDAPGGGLDLLERHGMLGAIEVGDDPAAWLAEAPGRMLVRKYVVGAGLEDAEAVDSDAYTAWVDPDPVSPATRLADYLERWREVDAELVVTADEARERKLPPIEVGVRLGGTGLFRIPPAHAPGFYAVLNSAPGGGAGFAIRPEPEEGRGGDLEQTARRMLQNPRGPELVSAGADRVQLAGGEAESICLYADWLSFRTASCVVRVPHDGGALLAIFICSVGSTEPSSRLVLGDASLRRIARTLRLEDPARRAKPG